MGGKKSKNTKKKTSNKNGNKRGNINQEGQKKQQGGDDSNNQKKKEWTNFVSEAGPGCYIVRRRTRNEELRNLKNDEDWIIEWEDIDPTEFEGEEDNVPDVAIDTDERTLSFCNVENETKVAYISVYDTKCIGSNRQVLRQGSTTDNNGITNSCVTFIVLCPSYTFVHLCYLDIMPDADITQTRIESDVQEWNQHPNPQDEHPMSLGFPLGQCDDGDAKEDDDEKQSKSSSSYLCTQGVDGELTHFFSGNLHAIDFRCPIGTPLLAVADGTVIESTDNNTLTGIAVSNLFEWNSVIIQVNVDENDEEQGHIEGPLFVEYVHISKSYVRKGDVVKKGQPIGLSGSVGFSPEPHLHFSAFRSSDPTAPTVGIKFQIDFQGDNNHDKYDNTNNTTTTYIPKAGHFYSAYGEVERIVNT